MSNKNNIVSKLVTAEDPYHVHKFCGIICILSYIYHAIEFTLYRQNNFSVIVPFIHILLHISTFIFHVLKKRGVKTMAMFIWEELRLHSFVFSLRACLILFFKGRYSVFITFLTMIIADIITYFYGDPNVTTVRGDHKKEKNTYYRLIGSFFSMSQLGATLFCMGFFQKDINLSLVFQTLIPIQTSAFGLTLLRKNIINKNTWQIIYTIELLLGYLMWYMLYGNLNIVLYVFILYMMRLVLPSKYLLWILALSYENYDTSRNILNILFSYLNNFY